MGIIKCIRGVPEKKRPNVTISIFVLLQSSGNRKFDAVYQASLILRSVANRCAFNQCFHNTDLNEDLPILLKLLTRMAVSGMSGQGKRSTSIVDINFFLDICHT